MRGWGNVAVADSRDAKDHNPHGVEDVRELVIGLQTQSNRSLVHLHSEAEHDRDEREDKAEDDDRALFQLNLQK